MIPHKLNGKLLFLALLGIILYFTSGLIMNISHNESMEEDLGAPKVTKAQAQEAALAYASDKLGFKAKTADIAYQSDKYTSGYVTRNKLAEEYGKKYGSIAPLDYWLVIAKDAAGQKVELRVGMDQPVVTSWEKPGLLPRTHDEKSVTAAMKALNGAGYNPDDFTYSPSTKKEDANRFTFISKKEAIGEAPMAITIGIRSTDPISFQTGFQVPDSYMDWIKHQEKLAAWMTGSFVFFTAAMGITAIVLAIIHGRKVAWSRGILLTVVFFGLYLLQNLNVTDAVLAAADHTGAASSGLASAIMTAFVVFIALLLAAAVWFSLLSGEQQWRMKGWSYWTRWRDPEFGRDVFYGMGRGYLICLFILGIQQAVFLVEANVFHSFGIPDPSQSPFNMRWPYLFPATAWVAAIMEEAIYRLFGIILFKRILRYNFPALLVTSVIWALGHTGYTLYPSYTRLIEVTILGFVFGYTFLKYGLITAMFAHAAMDSLLMALYVMTGDPSGANIAAGLFYIALPAIIGYTIRFIHPRWGGPRRRPPVQLHPGPDPDSDPDRPNPDSLPRLTP